MSENITGRNGGCLCGAVRYSVSGALDNVVGCHCSQCRIQTGHFVAATRIERAKIEITGEENLTDFKASDEATRSFCRICGSFLFWQMEDSANISILAGSLDQPSGLTMTHHIFVADKADYYELNDGLKQYVRTDK